MLNSSIIICHLLLKVPLCAAVKVPAYSFPEKFSSFSFTTLLTKAEVIAALVKVRTECNKVSSAKQPSAQRACCLQTINRTRHLLPCAEHKRCETQAYAAQCSGTCM